MFNCMRQHQMAKSQTNRLAFPAGYFLLLGFLAFSGGFAVQALGQVSFRTGDSALVELTSAQLLETLVDRIPMDSGRHFVVQFDGPVDASQRATLQAGGLTLTGYLGNNAFFAAVPPGGADQAAIAAARSLVDAQPVAVEWKLHPMLARGDLPYWAVVPVPEEVADLPGAAQETWIGAYLVFHGDVDAADARLAVRSYDVVIRRQLQSINGMVIELPISQVSALVGDDAVQYLEPALPKLEVVNSSNRAITEADIVQAAPYGLDGSGVSVMVYDGGTALASHLDFQGRLTNRDTSALSSHATHVAGTIGGAGVANPTHKGMAPAVTIESYGFEQVGGLQEGFLYTDPGDLEADYSDAINSYGVHIANNSIGTNTAPNGFPCEWEGDYGVTSSVIDAVVRGSLSLDSSPFRIIWANGNERQGAQRCGATYHTTAPPACAKNHITVGALNSNDDSVTSFTSWGPADDGRLKPDISAPGCELGGDGGVTSCSSAGTSSYTTFCGTSMASPTVTGLSALLLQDYRAQFPGQPDFRNSTLKTLLAHNALDIEAVGPDYMTGYGSVRIQQTVDFMRTGDFIEDQVDQGLVSRVLVVVNPGDTVLKATIAWDDPPGTPNVDPALVNDLDLRVFDPSGGQHFPWTLGGLADPAAPAVRTQADHINNIEQVLVDAPTPGVWTVEIFGFAVPQGPQTFSLCVSPGFTDDCNDNGINDLDDIADGTSEDCNTNLVPDECEPNDDCNSNGVADICDLATGSSQDINGNSIPDECDPDCNSNGLPDDYDISQGSSADCNNNGFPDECDIAGGTSTDCNTNGIADECETDCNNNGLPDACDIDGGSSNDCNTNGQPDECENDCNNNGIADECDLASGTSQDANSNGSPDECNVLYVDVTANGTKNGWSWVNAEKRLTKAIITAAGNSDVKEIWVAAGTYTPGPAGNTTNSFQLMNGLGLYGGFAGGETARSQRDVVSNETILSGDVGQDDIYEPWPSAWNINSSNSAHVVIGSGTDASAVIDGFTIMAGMLGAAGTPAGAPEMYGGGLYNISGSPTVRHCTFRYNEAAWARGGAIYNSDSSPLIEDCIFDKNYNHLGGGGAIGNVGASGPMIRGCTFTTNITKSSSGSEGSGAAISHYGTMPLVVDDCVFNNNTADNFYPTGSNAGSYGGAIHHFSGGLTVTNSVFTNNWSNVGGAIMSWDTTTIKNCLFANNSAPTYDSTFGWGGFGGAVAAQSFAGTTVNMTGCTIINNTAEDGGGVSGVSSGQIVLTNCVLWNNSDNKGLIGGSQASNNVVLSYCCIMNMLVPEPGEDPPDPANFPGSTDADPMFVDFAGGNYRVLAGSPCIDTGDPNFSVVGGTSDLDGLPRILCGRIDMGAYEMSTGNYTCNVPPDPTNYTNWVVCMNGPVGGDAGIDCAEYDSQLDLDVDLADFGDFQNTFAQGIPTLDPPATISGAVAYDGAATGAIHITATGAGQTVFVYTTILAAPGPYMLDIAVADNYNVAAFLDSNSNGVQDIDEPGNNSGSNPVSITTPGQAAIGIDISLGGSAVISGNVAFSSGTPQSGTTLTLSGPVADSTTSDGSGDYQFSGLGDGSYLVTPSQIGKYFYPFDAAVVLAGADAVDIDFQVNNFPTGEVDGEVFGAVTAVDSAGFNLTLDVGGTPITLFIYVDTIFSGDANILDEVQVGWDVTAQYYTSANLAVEIDAASGAR